MENERTSGRTPWDALVEVLSTWRLLYLILGFFILLFFVVHLSAEPGTTVEFFGLVKYQKAKETIATPIPLKVDETDSYTLPKNAVLSSKDKAAIPILDGTLAILYDGFYDYADGQIVGSNIGKIKIASRRLDGRPDETLYRSYDGSAVMFSSGTRLEIEYRGRVFAMSVEQSKFDSAMKVTLEKLPHATLDLLPVSKLSMYFSK